MKTKIEKMYVIRVTGSQLSQIVAALARIGLNGLAEKLLKQAIKGRG